MEGQQKSLDPFDDYHQINFDGSALPFFVMRLTMRVSPAAALWPVKSWRLKMLPFASHVFHNPKQGSFIKHHGAKLLALIKIRLPRPKTELDSIPFLVWWSSAWWTSTSLLQPCSCDWNDKKNALHSHVFPTAIFLHNCAALGLRVACMTLWTESHLL